MYKICAFVLALLVPAAGYATSGESDTEFYGTEHTAIQQLFSRAETSCTSALSAADLSDPGLLQSFYAELGYRPQWQSPQLRQQLQAQLDELIDDGLNPAHYALPSDYDPVCADVLISRNYLRALSHLSRGKVAQDSVDTFWREPQSASLTPRPSVLSLAWQGLSDPAQAFNQARPQQAQYQRLRSVYQTLRQQPMESWPSIARGPLLKPNAQDGRVPQIRQRLQVQGYLPASANDSSSVYDAELVAAVRSFQAQHNLQSDGIIGQDTLNALNTHPKQRLEQVRANLERWRWLENDLEPTILLVDIVGGMMSYYQDGENRWQTRTQVGRPNRKTPRLKSLVNRLTLNPTWTVPPTILRQDKLPEIRHDPSYLARHDMQVFNSQGQVLDPQTVDWQRPGNIMLRQAAGPRNPLGKLVIRFPNPFSVYLHDTPSQHLFEKSPRTFSSGCVRVEAIQNVLPLILSPEQSQAISSRIARGRTEQVNYQERLPVLLGYWTAEVTDDNQLIVRNDPYNLDPALLRALDQSPN